MNEADPVRQLIGSSYLHPESRYRRSVVARQRDGRSGFRFAVGERDLSLEHPQSDCGSQRSSYSVGKRGLSQRIKKPESEVDYSPPSTTEIRCGYS